MRLRPRMDEQSGHSGRNPSHRSGPGPPSDLTCLAPPPAKSSRSGPVRPRSTHCASGRTASAATRRSAPATRAGPAVRPRQLNNVLADVRRGIWQPPVDITPPPEPTPEPTFHEFASEWFAAKRTEIRPNTARSYYNDLTHHLLPYFAGHRLSQITIAQVDRYRGAKVREGRLKPRTINMTLALLAQILEVAVEYGHLERNPATGRRRRLKATRPRPVHLDSADHLAAMLEAAGNLDGSSRTRGRRAAIAVLLFAGLRAEELGALRWRDVDLANGRLYVGRS